MDGHKTTLKISARQKIQYSAVTYDRAELKKMLATLIEAYNLIFGCVALLEIARGESEFPLPKTLHHSLAVKASHRK